MILALRASRISSCMPRVRSWGLSGIIGLTLYAFNGFGEGFTSHTRWARMLPGFDLMFLISLANRAAFVSVLLSRYCRFDVAVPLRRSAHAQSGIRRTGEGR